MIDIERVRDTAEKRARHTELAAKVAMARGFADDEWTIPEQVEFTEELLGEETVDEYARLEVELRRRRSEMNVVERILTILLTNPIDETSGGDNAR